MMFIIDLFEKIAEFTLYAMALVVILLFWGGLGFLCLALFGVV